MKIKGFLILALTFATTFLASISGQLNSEPLVNFHWLMWLCVGLGSLMIVMGFLFDTKETVSVDDKQDRKKYPY